MSRQSCIPCLLILPRADYARVRVVTTFPIQEERIEMIVVPFERTLDRQVQVVQCLRGLYGNCTIDALCVLELDLEEKGTIRVVKRHRHTRYAEMQAGLVAGQECFVSGGNGVQKLLHIGRQGALSIQVGPPQVAHCHAAYIRGGVLGSLL